MLPDRQFLLLTPVMKRNDSGRFEFDVTTLYLAKLFARMCQRADGLFQFAARNRR